MDKTCYIKTLGCQMNVHDSERIAGVLKGQGYSLVDAQDRADLVVINTCSVREKADQKFFSELGRLKKVKASRPGLKIAVAGCIAQQQGGKIRSRFPHVDLIFGPQNITLLPEMLRSSETISVATDDNPDYHLQDVPAERTSWPRAWVSIMYGCDNFCSYCIVPYTRGRERSRPAADILDEVRSLVEAGYPEIILLGQNVNSYGKGLDEKVSFPELLKRVHDTPGLKRLRFVTSHPKDLSDGLMEAFRDLPRLCNHLHLPLQAGSDRVLARMNRGYTASDYLSKIARLRSIVPDMAFTTDIIVGFPGEDESDFDETLRMLKAVRYEGIFAFKYSKRPQTRARLFEDQLSDTEKSRRLSRVLEIQDVISEENNKALVGKVQDVLVEGPEGEGGGLYTGRSCGNKIVVFESVTDCTGKIVPVEITEGFQHSLGGILRVSY